MSGKIKIDIQKETCCQFTGEYCSKLANEVTQYAQYLAGLATKVLTNGERGSSDIFTNGADPVCCRKCSVYKMYDNSKQR